MKPIKEQLKGTCVLNEKEGMGAEIVALYTEAGIENDEALVGDCIGEYYGERDGIIDNQVSKEYFQTILTLSQLREIVKWKKSEEPQFKAGDVVEVETTKGEWIKAEYAFFAENQHWVYLSELKDSAYSYTNIRHPKDKLREKAEEIMAKRRKHDFSGVEYFTVGATEEMLIEAIKWSQENPKP